MNKITTLILFLSLNAMGAGTSDNVFTIGNNNDNAVDKQLCLNKGCTNIIQVPSGGGNIQLSNNSGSSFADVSAGELSNEAATIDNTTVATSVAANALTIDLKQSDGSTDPSVADPVRVSMRSSTITDGSYNNISVTSALSMVVTSGATLGHADGVDSFIYVYLLDNAGTLELAVSSVIKDESVLQSSQTVTSGADDNDLYSTIGRSNVPIRMIVRLESNQVTAGVWLANMAEISPGAHTFTDTTNNLAVKVEHNLGTTGNKILVSALIGFSAGTPSITSQDGTWLASLTDIGVGQTLLNFSASFFSSAPRCWGSTSEQINAGTMITVTIESTSAAEFRGRLHTGGLVDDPFRAFCYGSK